MSGVGLGTFAWAASSKTKKQKNNEKPHQDKSTRIHQRASFIGKMNAFDTTSQQLIGHYIQSDLRK